MTVVGLNNLLSILIIGSLVLLSIILLSNPLKVNRKANLFFAMFTLLWTTYWQEELFEFMNVQVDSEIFWMILKILQFFIPIFLFLGVKSFTSPFEKFKASTVKYLIIPLIYLIGLMYKSSLKQDVVLDKVLTVMIILHAIFYTILSLRLVSKHMKRIEEITSAKEEIDLKWIKNILLALLVMCLFLGLYGLLVPMKHLNIVGNTISFASVIYVTYYLLKQKEIFDLSEEQIVKIFPDNRVPEARQMLLSEAEIQKLKKDLSELMVEKRPFLDRELSLKKLSELMNISPHHLSFLLNEGMGENFFQYVNRFRAEEAKKLLMSPDHQHLSKMGIAFEAGFNSKTAFNTFFKKHTDMTPTEFVKMRTSG